MSDTPDMAFLTPAQLADRWSLHVNTLANWRAQGRGPAWTAIGGAVRYALTDIEEWESQQRRLGKVGAT